MGAAASVSAEAELSTFKEMRTKFEELKATGKTDEEIYAELKTLYNASAAAATVPAPAATAGTDAEKRASHASAEAAAAAAEAVAQVASDAAP